MFHKFLQCSEWSPPSYEETALVQLSEGNIYQLISLFEIFSAGLFALWEGKISPVQIVPSGHSCWFNIFAYYSQEANKRKSYIELEVSLQSYGAVLFNSESDFSLDIYLCLFTIVQLEIINELKTNLVKSSHISYLIL